MLKPTNYLLLLALWVAFIQMAFGQQKLRIVASASMIADIATNIVGDGQSIETLVPVGGDPHLHEPTPSNARQVADADLILINGLTFEGWITELIENSGTDAQVITVTQGLDVLSSSTYANSADPHAWMDASNGILYATNIANALIELDPLEEDSYLRNLSAYTDRLNKLDTEIAAMVSTIPASQRVLVTSHDAFQYFGRRYGIRLEAIMGISTEAEAQTADIRRVTRAIRESNIPAIFIESTIN
ncbi:MAG: zinc ABC transporter substrate-binding protein, partial [Bacteroidota bacterium]